MRILRKAFAVISSAALMAAALVFTVSASNVVYKNDFEGGVIDVDDMKSDGHAVIKEEGGNKYLSLTTNSTVEGEAGYLQTAIGPDDLTDFDWSMKIRPDKYNTDTWNWIKVFVRSNRTENESYHIELWTWRTCLSAKSAASNKSEDEKLVENDEVTAAAGKWYTLEIFGRGNVISAYLDGTKIGEISDALFKSGACGFCTWGVDMSVDDVVITSVSASDPVSPKGKPSSGNTQSTKTETSQTQASSETKSTASTVSQTESVVSKTETTSDDSETTAKGTVKGSAMTAAQIIMIIASAVVILVAGTGEYFLVWRALDYKKHITAETAVDSDTVE